MKIFDLDKVLFYNCFSWFFVSHHHAQQHIALLQASMQAASRGYKNYKEKVIRNTMPNNWLKLHGYRMRRRVR